MSANCSACSRSVRKRRAAPRSRRSTRCTRTWDSPARTPASSSAPRGPRALTGARAPPFRNLRETASPPMGIARRRGSPAAFVNSTTKGESMRGETIVSRRPCRCRGDARAAPGRVRAHESTGGASQLASACARVGAQPYQARHLRPVRQHASHAGQPERSVRPRADAEPPELPQGQRHAAEQALHDSHLAHRRRDPQLADRPLSGPDGHHGLELVRLLPVDRHPDVLVGVQVLEFARSPRRTTTRRTW